MVVAFFPGKFQPPHIGHVMLLAQLIREYDEVIVGISEDTPRIMSQDEVSDMFKVIYPDLNIFKFERALTEYDKIDNFPSFDILITAENKEVIEWCKRKNINCRNIKRFEFVGCRSRDIRKIIYNDMYDQKTFESITPLSPI